MEKYKNPQPLIEQLKNCETEIKNSPVAFVFLDKKWGNFKPSGPNYASNLEQIRKEMGFEYVFAPKLTFNRRPASFTNEKEEGFGLDKFGRPQKYIDEGILRTVADADGGVIFLDELEKIGVDPKKIAIAGSPADCPYIVGYDTKNRALFLLHGGTACIFKKGEKGGNSVFNELLEKNKLDPNHISVFISRGAQKCCYGNHDNQIIKEVADIYGEEYTAVATSGPRTDKPSIDLPGMIYQEIVRTGVKPENIEIDKTCTVHEGDYWSNIKGDTERNLILAYLKKSL